MLAWPGAIGKPVFEAACVVRSAGHNAMTHTWTKHDGVVHHGGLLRARYVEGAEARAHDWLAGLRLKRQPSEAHSPVQRTSIPFSDIPPSAPRGRLQAPPTSGRS
eukprot:scaffold3911_cov212-Pinguiococcus_pyrenoidosus.AAC.3